MSRRAKRHRTGRPHDERRQWFARRGLDLAAIWRPGADDPAEQARHLELLQQWVLAYERTPERSAMERQGFRCPPIEPDVDPDTGWRLFEHWMRGTPCSWSYVEEFGEIPDPAGLDDEQAGRELEAVEENLASCGVRLVFHDGVPPRLALGHLRQTVEAERFETVAENACVFLDGCDGYCPSCFQRPWCEAGREPGWYEDEAAGRLVVPAEVEPYLAR